MSNHKGQTAHLRVVGGDGKKAPALRGVWTADQLMAEVFPEPRWAIPGLVAEGVTLLAGPPKVGKSWLSLGFAIAVALGGRALDMIPVQAGPVLYLALEDTPRRLQNRMRIVLAGQKAPSNLHIVTACPPMTQGGDTAIAAWLDVHKDARLVIIDVFAKVRGNSAPGASAYDADYAAVTRIKRIADHYGVAIVLVHHVRKQGSEDFLAEVSGTNGIAGAADTTIVLKRARGQADGVLHITGRDVDESEMALRFHAAAGAWQLLDGPAQDHTLGDTRSAVLSHLRANPQANTPKTIATATGIDAALVRRTVARMAEAGQLHRGTDGTYRPVEENSHLAVTPVTPVSQPELSSENDRDTQSIKVSHLSQQTAISLKGEQ